MGRTPLHLACECGNVETMVWLLEQRANANAKTLSGMAPIHFCCREKHAACVKALLSIENHVIDLDEPDARRKTAAHYAAGDPRIGRLLKQYRTVRKSAIKKNLVSKYC